MPITIGLQWLDWVALGNRRIAAPFKPQIKNELDVSNFSDDFTSMAVADSPAAVPLDGTKIFRVTVTTNSTTTATANTTTAAAVLSRYRPIFKSISPTGLAQKFATKWSLKFPPPQSWCTAAAAAF